MPDAPVNSGFEAVETIFQAALELKDETERRAYLGQVCGHDAALRQRVEALLNAHREAAERPNFLPEHHAAVRLEKAGDHIGQYTLVEEIGAGAFGVVWKARQEKPFRREVALKIIKAGMDTRQVMARFEAERQALALMDHPNIAKVFDAGATEAGRPYFVMELVRGARITDYCDAHNLPTRERLLLFAQVCRALHHAHLKGIIHRDIKPSNVLVCPYDGVPTPKVIDFGIAKATEQRLTEETIVTATGQFLGTPAYMSPEQAGMRGQAIDARSDIYSLGVLLYELLTGQPPVSPAELQRLALDEALRTIREKEPPRPSTRLATLTDQERTTVAQRRQAAPAQLSRLLRTELDWVVMRCLEKDSTRRYATAGDLADDIQCHLDHKLLLHALPPGRLYRLWKSVRRHKVVWGAGCAVVAIVAAFLAWTHTRPGQWRKFPIRVKGRDKSGEYVWKGIDWGDQEVGWLCGEKDPHGGGDNEHMGHGVLLHTADGGRSWEEFNATNIESGTGTNRHWSNEVWTDVGPITSVHIEMHRQPDGRTCITNGWITSWTGIYHTTNAASATEKWWRVTPRPDGPEAYGHIEGMLPLDSFLEIYAFGWQGIARWTNGDRWRVQMQTVNYEIYSLRQFGSQSWAVGNRGEGTNSHPAVYRQQPPGGSWEPVALEGIHLQPRQNLRDLISPDPYRTIFAVGDEGIILRGSEAGTNWVWKQLASNTKKNLNAIDYDNNSSTLWAVGAKGTIIKSTDQGETWVEVPCHRGWWRRVRNDLTRIFPDRDGVWIVGDKVVLRLDQP